jgi:predicted RNA-binding protein with TRAM domain
LDGSEVPKCCRNCAMCSECKLVEEGSTDICKYFIPVSVGNIHKVKIEDISQNGEGIARIKKFNIIVPGTNVGENVTIEIKSIKGRRAFATKIKPKSETQKKSKSILVPYSMSSNADGELIPMSPWTSSEGKRNRSGAKCGKCKECGGSIKWDSKLNTKFCEKCGLEY